jgi:putative ABC transport system substrate-binding protein
MRRRTVLAGFCAAAALPRGLLAQNEPLPVIGFLSSASADHYTIRLDAFREGLAETGYVEGRNVKIEYRWAGGENDRLPALAVELVRRGVSVIAAGGGTPAAIAAKAATSTIPIVFGVSTDPVEVGLVSSLSRPGGNLTGVTNQSANIGPKRLQLMRELVPGATTIAVLLNPTSSQIAEPFLQALQAAARGSEVQVLPLYASTETEIHASFTKMAELRVGALVISPDVLFNEMMDQIGALSLRYAVPTVYQYRKFTAAGGLVSYGSDEVEYYRVMGVDTGKILKGDKPSDLPVQRLPKVQLIINLKTAKSLGITVPLTLLGRADEVIE